MNITCSFSGQLLFNWTVNKNISCSWTKPDRSFQIVVLVVDVSFIIGNSSGHRYSNETLAGSKVQIKEIVTFRLGTENLCYKIL